MLTYKQYKEKQDCIAQGKPSGTTALGYGCGDHPRNESEEQEQEQEEEQNGFDLDHDKEKGEPKEHKAKVDTAKQEMLDFFKKRKDGAADISKKSKAKGGASILTYWHFSAKAAPYNEVLRAIKNDESEAFFLGKCKEIFASIQCGKMTQRNFQKAVGKLEVWGEALAELFK